ncbi:HNH endonuclease family protein [Dietzia sp. 179-F 9C3 NHS]|uniref:HNH endonuclease family protein n=1 Tax=Dietzia sp. 179-F 9C3 NHS TaxID=3374295 RepID=UPI0038794DA8
MRKSSLSSFAAVIAVAAGLLYISGEDVGTVNPPTAQNDVVHVEQAAEEPVEASSPSGNPLADAVEDLFGSTGSGEPVGSSPAGDWTVDVGATRAALAGLEVKGKAPKTGYSRSEFGRAWDDDVPVEYGGNGCDQRQDVLRRDLVNIQMRDRCTVTAGTLQDDPYTGKTIAYTRDRTSDVDIDHRVALSHAWQTGAQQWSPEKRLAFANDPRNLVAVDASANRQKGDGDAATWLPSNKPYRCTYVATQVEVKSAYGLWVTPAEQDAISRVLDAC